MATTSTLPIRVQLFARYAEVLGRESVALNLPAGATVADAVTAIRSLPGGTLLPARPLVARALEQVLPDVPLAAGDELALLPPMSGG
ncbi:MAG TPA: MoaD/ThiS family protein [Gemmatimonadales bacterium]